MGHYPTATGHAFEPAPDNFGLLAANFGNRPGISLNQAAVDRTDSPIAIHIASHGAMHPAVDPSVVAETIQAPFHRLANYFDRHDLTTVDPLKLNVEGSELEVLDGLGERLRNVPVIVGEMPERIVDPIAFYQSLDDGSSRWSAPRRITEGATLDVLDFRSQRTWGRNLPPGQPEWAMGVRGVLPRASIGR